MKFQMKFDQMNFKWSLIKWTSNEVWSNELQMKFDHIVQSLLCFYPSLDCVWWWWWLFFNREKRRNYPASLVSLQLIIPCHTRRTSTHSPASRYPKTWVFLWCHHLPFDFIEYNACVDQVWNSGGSEDRFFELIVCNGYQFQFVLSIKIIPNELILNDDALVVLIKSRFELNSMMKSGFVSFTTCWI